MDDNTQPRLIMQILIGSAWADRQLAPAEVAYLQNLLQRYHLDHDSALLDLL